MNLVITGADGMLGRALRRCLMNNATHGTVLLGRSDADISNPESRIAIQSLLCTEPGSALINCAAYTNVNGAETEREASYQANCLGPANLARWTAEVGARLIHVSTDYVFDGSSPRPYLEDDPVRPINAYGASKLAGELAVAHLNPEHHAIVRTSWLYGPDGNCFPATILRLAREAKPLSVVADQWGAPTLTLHLAPLLVDLAVRPSSPATTGIFHATNSGRTTWHEFAKSILAQVGLQDTPIRAISSAEFPSPARRPTMSVLENTRLAAAGVRSLPSWETGLRDYFLAIQS